MTERLTGICERNGLWALVTKLRADGWDGGYHQRTSKTNDNRVKDDGLLVGLPLLFVQTDLFDKGGGKAIGQTQRRQ